LWFHRQKPGGPSSSWWQHRRHAGIIVCIWMDIKLTHISILKEELTPVATPCMCIICSAGHQ
jgi:hypothetical protein